MVLILDDEDRENEGDLIMAAEHATPEAMAFMIRHSSGIICVPMEEERLLRLELPQMVGTNNDSYRTAFHSLGRLPPRGPARASPQPIAPRPSPRWRIPRLSPPTSPVPGTSFRCGRAAAECWCARATRKRPWTCVYWPALSPRVSCVNS